LCGVTVASILCNKAAKGWISEPDEVAVAVAVAVEVAGSNVFKVLPLAFKDVPAPAAGITALADMPTDEPTPGPNIVGPRPKKDELPGGDEGEDPCPAPTEEEPPIPNDEDEDEDELPTPIPKDVDKPPTPATPKDEVDAPIPTPNTEVPLSLTKAVPFPDESSPYSVVPVRFGVARDRKGWLFVVAMIVVVVGVYIVFESKVPKSVTADIDGVAVTDVVVG